MLNQSKKKGVNTRSNLTWVSPSYTNGSFSSKSERIDKLCRLNFFIKKMEVVEKDPFEYNGKTIPKQNVLRLFSVAEFDEKIGEENFCLELQINDRFKTCNVFVNKLAFAVDQHEKSNCWDGFCQLSIYTAKGTDKKRLFCTLFTDEEREALNLPQEQNLFPYSEELQAFEGIPRIEPIMYKGKHLKKNDVFQYDTEAYDLFMLDLVNDLCERVNEMNF